MKAFLPFVLLIISTFSFGQKEIKVSDNLTLTKLSENVYVQTDNHSNGLVYVVGKEVVIISTPTEDNSTIELLNWIKKELKATVTACIVDHWHGDAMEGVDVLYKEGIESYTHKQTILIANKMKLFAPTKGFDDSLTISVGDKKISMRYFGPNHTADGIMVWLPDEKVLFGGCGVKSNGGYVGNIADAHLPDWSITIEKVKAAYPDAKIVVPGHGQHGGVELLDYTIKMFEEFRPKKSTQQVFEDFTLDTVVTNSWAEIVNKEKDTIIDCKYYLIDAYVIMDKDSETIHIASPLLEYDSLNKTIKADEAGLYIVNPKTKLNAISFGCKKLIIMREEELRLSLMVNEFVKF